MVNMYLVCARGRFYVTTKPFSVSNLNIFPPSVGPGLKKPLLDTHGQLCYLKQGYSRKGRLMALPELKGRKD